MAKKKEYTENIKNEAIDLIKKENDVKVIKNKGGRPSIDIDYEMVSKLARMMCTMQEIASFLDLSVRKLEQDEEFIRVYKKNIDTGKISLRRSQMKLADAGNTTMNIWLGKQYLGQTDKIEQKQEDKLDVLIETLGSAIKNAR